MADPEDITASPEDAPDEIECSAFDLLQDMTSQEQASVLRTIVDDLPDAVIVHKLDGSILFFNESACRLLGYTHAEMLELGPFGWIAHGARVGGQDRLDAIVERERLTFESAALRKDGDETPTEISARSIASDEGPLIVSVIRDITVRKADEERLVYLAFHDSLTGLPNRAALEERLRTAIADSRRHNDVLALAYIDLDHFKPINDRYGHQIGDQALVTIAKRMTGAVREQDHVSRIGGDEFVVVLPRLGDESELGVLARRLLAEIREPIEACGYECQIEASIGFALFDAAVDDARSLVVKADLAMYAAKREPGEPVACMGREHGHIPSGLDTPIGRRNHLRAA